MTENRPFKELLQYRRVVEIGKENNKDIRNRGREFAAVLLYNIFSLTKKELFILSEKMASEVTNYNQYKKELEACILRGCEVKILLEKNIETNSKSYEMLKKLYNSGRYNNLKIAIINQKAQEILKKGFNGNIPNFCINENSYRVEGSKDSFIAIGKLNLQNEDSVISYLKINFSEAFSVSNPIKHL